MSLHDSHPDHVHSWNCWAIKLKCWQNWILSEYKFKWKSRFRVSRSITLMKTKVVLVWWCRANTTVVAMMSLTSTMFDQRRCWWWWSNTYVKSLYYTTTQWLERFFSSTPQRFASLSHVVLVCVELQYVFSYNIAQHYSSHLARRRIDEVKQNQQKPERVVCTTVPVYSTTKVTVVKKSEKYAV